MPPTPEQARVLEASEPFVPVAAGAGAGKTTLLVERIWRDVEHEGVPIERILVVTFNRSAAAHLRDRLQQRFGDRDAGRSSDRASLDLSAGWIGTFHGLSARIVRMHPFLAGVDPEFSELDDVEADALVEQALDDALAATTHPGLLDALAQAVYDGGIRQAVLSAYARLRAAGHREPRLVLPPPPVLDPADAVGAARLLDELVVHPDLHERHAAGIAAGRVLLSGEGPLPKCPKIHGTAKKGVKPLIDDANELLCRIWTDRVALFARPQLEALAEVMERFATGYAQRKVELGALDYEDLQFHALDVLRAGVSLGLDRVYVDEFQDANAIQNEIVDALGARRTWVVGDGGQAIYGFRHATSRFFAERVGDPPRYALRDNHRSQPELMEALNDVFAHALAGEPAFRSLHATAATTPAPPLRRPPIELVSVSDADRERSTRDQEAEAVADAVEGLLHDGYANRDVAVLFRALTMVEPYERALRVRGIPTYLVAGRGFFSHQQVADVLALLHLVDNPHHEDHLVRVLGSPYVNASDGDLVALRRHAGTKRPLWPAVPGIPALAPLVDLVAALRPVLRESGLPALVEAAIAANGYDLAVLGLEGGRRRFANLRRLVQMAESFAEVRGPDLPGFLHALAERDRLGQDPGEAVVVDPDLDAVRLTTIHAVKGQEFPAVVIADGSHGMPGQQDLLMVDTDGRAGFRAKLAGGDPVDLFGAADLKERLQAEAAAEERRVFYVALTRAKRHVTVVGRPDGRGGPNCMWSLLKQAIDAGSAFAAETAVAAASIVVPERRPAPAAPPVAAAHAPVPAEPLSVDALAGRRLSFTALQALHEAPGEGAHSGAVPAADGGGAVVGTLVHVALERHRWLGPHSATAPPPGWAAPLAASLGLGPLPPAHAERAESLVRDVLASPLAERIRTALRVETEHPFAVVVDGVLLAGAIDLLAWLPDGTLLVVDWKTHALDGKQPNGLRGEYELQAALYSLAALRAGTVRVDRAWVFLGLSESPRTTMVVDADVPTIETVVRSALSGASARSTLRRTPPLRANRR